MAIDPRISLAARAPNIAPAINIFENALLNSQTRDIRGQQLKQQALLNPLQVQQQQQNVDINQQSIDTNRQQQRLLNIHQTGQRLKPFLDAGDAQGAQKFMLDNISALQTRIEAGENIDLTESLETLQKLQSGDFQGVLGDINAVSGLINQAAGRGATAQQREFTQLSELAQGDQNSDITKAARIKLGLDPRAGISAQERIAGSEDLTTQVATSEAAIEGAKSKAREGGKLVQQRKHLPGIRSAVKLAEKAAIARGDTLTDLKRLEAAKPGLVEAVGQLRELATIATSTFLGRLFDSAVRETGFGATKGGTARAKFVAIINNQVLPLLRETFGAAFTEREGETLKATMGDPNTSPEEKLVQLDAFIDQKERNIRAKQAEVGQTTTQSEFTSPSGITFTVK